MRKPLEYRMFSAYRLELPVAQGVLREHVTVQLASGWRPLQPDVPKSVSFSQNSSSNSILSTQSRARTPRMGLRPCSSFSLLRSLTFNSQLPLSSNDYGRFHFEVIPVTSRSKRDYEMTEQTKEKVAIITGAAGGIGRATAHALAK